MNPDPSAPKAAFTKAEQARERGNAELLKAATLEGVEDELQEIYNHAKQVTERLRDILADLGRVVT